MLAQGDEDAADSAETGSSGRNKLPTIAHIATPVLEWATYVDFKPGRPIAGRRVKIKTTMATFSYARLFIASLALGLVMAGNAAAQTQSPPKPAEATSAAKTLKTSIIWQDEFEGPSGGAPDPHKWSYDLGAGGWGNNELEEYTNSRENSALNGQGQLVITVRRDAAGHYTSARLKTEAKFDFTFGRRQGSKSRKVRASGLPLGCWAPTSSR